MQKMALVVSLVLAGCGTSPGGAPVECPSANPLPSQIGAASDVVGLVTMQASTDWNYVTAAFATQTLSFAGIPLAGDCHAIDMDAQPGLYVPGTGERDLGATVVLQSGTAAITMSPNIGFFYYQEPVDSQLVPDASYDLVAAQAAPAFTVTGAVHTAAELTVTAPVAGARVSRGSPLTVSWTGAGGDYVEILVYATDQAIHAGFACIVPDTGCFTAPGSATSLLGSGVTPAMTVVRHVVRTTKVEGLGSVLGLGSYAAWAILSP